MLLPVQLRIFVTAVAEGSLSAAARRLGLTQPAVSQHLAHLEAATGRDLLIRSRKGVTLTPAGDIVLQHGREILGIYASLKENLDILSGEVSGTVTISANILFNRLVMLPVFARVVEDHPRLRLKLHPTDEFVALDRDGIDIALRSGEPGPDGFGVVRKVAEIDMANVATPSYLAKTGAPSCPGELKKLNYIQFRDDPAQTHMDLLFEGAAGPVPIKRAFGAQSADLLFHAITTDLGFARLPRFAITEELNDGRLVEILPATPPTPKPIFLLQHPDSVDLARNKVLRQLIFDQLAKLDRVRLVPAAAAERGTGLDPIEAAS